MAAEGRWVVGQQMSQDEGDAFIEEVDWSDILAATTHPFPGGYFSDPYQGNHLKATPDGDLFDWTPDIDGEFENDAPTYLGRFKNDEELIDFAVSFVLDGDHEVSAAIAFHYKDERFADWPGYFAAALPEFYWLRCSYTHDDFPSRLDAHLVMVSPLFKLLAGFFESPDDDAFAEVKQTVLKGDDFGPLFERYKYSS